MSIDRERENEKKIQTGTKKDILVKRQFVISAKRNLIQIYIQKLLNTTHVNYPFEVGVKRPPARPPAHALGEIMVWVGRGGDGRERQRKREGEERERQREEGSGRGWKDRERQGVGGDGKAGERGKNRR